jgi:hypothetical protein
VVVAVPTGVIEDESFEQDEDDEVDAEEEEEDDDDDVDSVIAEEIAVTVLLWRRFLPLADDDNIIWSPLPPP